MKSPMIVFAMAILFGFLYAGCRSSLNDQTVLLKVSSDPTISFAIWFKVGSQNDPSGKEGLAQLTAAMLTEASTQQNSYDQILEQLYPMAASYSASVDKEMTVISGRIHRDNLDRYFDLFTQAIISPAFKPEDFERIKSNTINYLEKTLRYANDEALGKEVLYQAIFKQTPYGHPEAGLIESVKSITLDDIKNFYKKYFARDNLVIGIGGGFDNELVHRLKQALNKLPKGAPVPVEKPSPLPIDGRQVILVEKDTRSSAISIGFPIDVLRGEDDFYALWLANSWFGEHRNSSSHLYQVIREARGMNYGDYSYIECFPNGWARQFPAPNVGRRQQIFEIWIRPVQTEAAHFALRAAIRELQKLVDNGMTQQDFELTRKFLKKYYLHYAPTTSLRLGYQLDDKFYGVQDHLKKFPEMLDRLTLEQVNAAIKRHLQYQNLKIVIVTNNAIALKQALIADAPSPMKYVTPKPAEVLQEDREIERYPLNIKPENVTIIPVAELFLR
ncbi:MAG: insulinase family protein [candidate division KSB1 bacterium]|nr:insulinase family protein [candidate division KSB1 bacterium]MDZ7334979.1 insulinase family protein [candidate division KSB1 bacterium]MDZ7357144.1 insulinase family protein [candidate division KSB1 bacterium]MDZ7376176.1 insulinase family protein [candidate division KSB1 bacterium]MDZ7400212.1 insulinase family protein [candidate division KSB1 bacterium]